MAVCGSDLQVNLYRVCGFIQVIFSKYKSAFWDVITKALYARSCEIELQPRSRFQKNRDEKREGGMCEPGPQNSPHASLLTEREKNLTLNGPFGQTYV